MILAVMTGASLGHTSPELQADRSANCIYAAVFIAASIRNVAAPATVHSATLLGLSGFAWIAAFLRFAVAYGPMLAKPRL